MPASSPPDPPHPYPNLDDRIAQGIVAPREGQSGSRQEQKRQPFERDGETEASVSTAELQQRIDRLERDLVLSSEEYQSQIRTLGRKNVELVNTVAAQLANQTRSLSVDSEWFMRSRSYRIGLLAADFLRSLRTFRRRLRRGSQNPLFDRSWYLETYQDVRWSGADPYEHYLKFGAAEGRKPNSVFESTWYLRTYGDVAASGVNPLVHYFAHGAREGRNPSPGFDTKEYLRVHPEIGNANPLLHFLAEQKTASASQRTWRGDGILVVASHCPSRAHAGGLRMLDLYSTIRKHSPDVEMDLFTRRQPDIDWSYEDLPGIFSNVYFAEGNDLSVAGLKRQAGDGPRYATVDFQFHEAGNDIKNYRKIASRLIFTPMELLSRGFSMQAESDTPAADPFELREQREATRREIALCRAVDMVVCVSEPDAEFLRRSTDLTNVVALETGVSMLEFGELAESTVEATPDPTVIFVAYFGSATNVAALEWYLREVHPVVKAAVPAYRFQIVGRGRLPAYIGTDDPSIEIVGEVSSVGPFIQNAAVGIAPALGGAGFRGKINQYSILGLPTIASPIATEGMAYRDKEDIIVGWTSAEFAAGCVLLLKDVQRRQEIATRARETCMRHYSWAAKSDRIAEIYQLLDPPSSQPRQS